MNQKRLKMWYWFRWFWKLLRGDSIILTADDLIGLAENVNADGDDEVKLVHLADRSQGEIVDNGDGTWTFTPAHGFTGEADIAYVIDKDGVLSWWANWRSR